jgi:hypothetical protein
MRRLRENLASSAGSASLERDSCIPAQYPVGRGGVQQQGADQHFAVVELPPAHQLVRQRELARVELEPDARPPLFVPPKLRELSISHRASSSPTNVRYKRHNGEPSATTLAAGDAGHVVRRRTST